MVAGCSDDIHISLESQVEDITQRIFQGPNYKCLTRETRQGDLHLFFHTDSENQIFKIFYHSVKKFVGHMATPTGQILFLPKISKLEIINMTKIIL